ncbi:hypothetical protein PHLCEN_2v1908 [Hermanssonia centrifuga]|uniref:Inhibitor I9 domain-containing protein n=1 Tax=Hermanssonia centrifuga TaxID=98765 RepID=A0A2R6RVF1_9APHY|nr:hypothetical protein PHLCEN_2v1908 [Hermanssonia centrifuga]
MKSISTALACLALLVAPILGAPTAPLIEVQKSAGEAKQGSYIVKLKDHVVKTNHLSWLSQHLGASSAVTHAEWDTDFLHGFAGTFSTVALNALRASPDVEYIEEDGVMSINSVVAQFKSLRSSPNSEVALVGEPLLEATL